MKTVRFFQLSLLLAAALIAPSSIAQDYTQWGLPEDAKARLGKGKVTGNFAFSPDWTRLAVATSIGVWLYDAATGAEIDLLTGHTEPVRSVAFSPNGLTIVSASNDKTIRLWDARTGESLHTLFDHAGTVRFRSLFARWIHVCQ